MSENLKKRWDALKDVNWAKSLAGIEEPNTAILLEKILENNDEATIALLEEKDKEAMVLQKKQDDEDERRLEIGHEVKTFDVNKVDDMNLNEVKDILKKVIVCLQW
jgi:DNA-binding PucR family transcriptional regulator